MALAERLHMSVEKFWSLSETEQADWRARVEAERETCKFHGGPVDECDDDDRDWYPQLSICWPSAILAAAQATFADLHAERPYHNGSPDRYENPAAWAKERSLDFPFHLSDGASMWLSTEEIPGPDFLGVSARTNAPSETPEQ